MRRSRRLREVGREVKTFTTGAKQGVWGVWELSILIPRTTETARFLLIEWFSKHQKGGGATAGLKIFGLIGARAYRNKNIPGDGQDAAACITCPKSSL
jgi:hypothetical protein